MPGRRRDPDIDRRIGEAARAVHAEQGYAAVTITEVARRAGVPRSSVYRRYRTVVALRYETLVLPEGGLAPLDPITGPDDLRCYVADQASAFRSTAAVGLLRCLSADVLGDESARLDQVQRFLGPRLDAVASWLAEARAAGHVPARVDPALAARAVTGTLIYTALHLGEPVTDATVEALVRMVFGEA